MTLEAQAQQHVQDIIEKNYQTTKDTFILLVYDEQSPLAKLLSKAYQAVMSDYRHLALNFDTEGEDKILAAFASLPAHSVVILVESISFRMTKHRLRADLFRAGHKVVEHARVSYNKDDQIQNYINSLAYHTPYYVKASNAIEQLLITNNSLKIESGNGKYQLHVNSAFDEPLKNTADFSDNPSASTGFPIGEIFTEAKELDKINGEVVVFGFPYEHKTLFPEPFIVVVKDGCVVSHTGPQEFEEMLAKIRSEELGGKVQIREIGFGLNRGLSFDHRIDEPTSFERFTGMHFSLGLKHAMYRKKIDKKVLQKYHIDIFCNIDCAFIGDTKIFENKDYVF